LRTRQGTAGKKVTGPEEVGGGRGGRKHWEGRNERGCEEGVRKNRCKKKEPANFNLKLGGRIEESEQIGNANKYFKKRLEGKPSIGEDQSRRQKRIKRGAGKNPPSTWGSFLCEGDLRGKEKKNQGGERKKKVSREPANFFGGGFGERRMGNPAKKRSTKGPGDRKEKGINELTRPKAATPKAPGQLHSQEGKEKLLEKIFKSPRGSAPENAEGWDCQLKDQREGRKTDHKEKEKTHEKKKKKEKNWIAGQLRRRRVGRVLGRPH